VPVGSIFIVAHFRAVIPLHKDSRLEPTVNIVFTVTIMSVQYIISQFKTGNVVVECLYQMVNFIENFNSGVLYF